MHYTGDIAACLLAYEEFLLSPPWNEKPAVHVARLRDLTGKYFYLLSPDEFALLRKILNLHASYTRPQSLYDNEEPRHAAYIEEDYITGTLAAIEAFLKLFHRGIDDSERLQLEYTFPNGKLPDDVTEILNLTYEEILKDYANGCFISAIALCGKVLETCLSSLFIRVCGRNPDEEKLGFDAMVNRLKKAGFDFHSATSDQMALISAHRNKAVHGSIVIPTADEARGVISLTKDVMLKVASK